jgi:hypothetical protein
MGQIAVRHSGRTAIPYQLINLLSYQVRGRVAHEQGVSSGRLADYLIQELKFNRYLLFIGENNIEIIQNKFTVDKT